MAIHVDVDVVDSSEIVFGLGAEPDGLTSDEVRRLVADVGAVADVVGVTIAEFIPRQVIRLQQVVRDFPLIEHPASAPGGRPSERNPAGPHGRRRHGSNCYTPYMRRESMRLNIVPVFPAAVSLLLLLFGAYWWGHSVLDPAYVPSTGLLGGGGLGLGESLAWFPCLFFSWVFGLSAAFFGRRYRLTVLNTLIYGVISLKSWEIATSRSLDLPLHGVAVLLFLVQLAVVFAVAILTAVLTCHPT